jgi:CubicO group peptidase (beta-lactamase class C family)
VVAVGDAQGPLLIETVPGPRTKRLRPESIFFLASLTKPIVATAAMGLVDAGLVELQAPIATYVPAFRGPGKDRVTLWHVLTHTSGIRDIHTDVLRSQRPSAARILETVCTAPLDFEPGTRYEYCSSSFALVAEIIARTDDSPFPEALRRRVFAPAGMVDTSFDPRHDRSRIVPVEGVPLRNVLVRELVLRYLARAAMAGGGLWGTAADLLRFGQALLPGVVAKGQGLLSPQAVDEMTREQTAGILEISPDGVTRDPRYGLGWGKPRIDGGIPSVVGGGAPAPDAMTADAADRLAVAGTEVPSSPRAFTHGGASGARLWIDPDRDLVFVFLTNLWGAGDGPMFDVLAGVYEAFDERRPPVPAGRDARA